MTDAANTTPDGLITEEEEERLNIATFYPNYEDSGCAVIKIGDGVEIAVCIDNTGRLNLSVDGAPVDQKIAVNINGARVFQGARDAVTAHAVAAEAIRRGQRP